MPKINTNVKKVDLKRFPTYVPNSNPPKVTLDMLELSEGPIKAEKYNATVESYASNITIDNFRKIFETGEESHSSILRMLTFYLQTEINNGNEEAYKLLGAIIKLKTEHPDFSFKLGESCYYHPATKTVAISIGGLLNSSSIIHEIGHALHHLNAKLENPWNFARLQSKARKNIEENSYWMYMDYFSQQQQYAYNYSKNNVGKDFSMSYDEYLEYYTSSYISRTEGNEERARELAQHEIESQIQKGMEPYIRSSGTAAMEDIMDAIYAGDLYGHLKDSKGNTVNMYGHGKKYYDGVLAKISGVMGCAPEYNELIANYTDLRVSNNTQSLHSVKYMIGEELYTELEKTYEKAIGY